MTGSAPTDLGNRIQGFLSRMADNDLEVVPGKAPGGGTEYTIYAVRMGERVFLSTVRSPSELERMIANWDENGWPISEAVDAASAHTTSSPSATTTGSSGWSSAALHKAGLPDWVSEFPRDKIVLDGNGSYSDMPKQSLIHGTREVLRNQIGKIVTPRVITGLLLNRFPNSTLNPKSVSASLTPLRQAGELKRVRKGVYEVVRIGTGAVSPPKSPKSSTSSQSSPSSSKTTSSGADQTLLDLLAMGADWKMVGRRMDGTPLFTVGKTGEVYAILVSFEQV